MPKRPRNPDPAAADAALWSRVIATVAPLPGRPRPPVVAAPKPVRGRVTLALAPPSPLPPAPDRGGARTLDGRWDRDIKRGAIVPDRTIDLHERTLSDAHATIDRELEAARRDGLRVLVLVTGKPRADARSAAGGRGAIRAQIGDWLAASRHAGAIAAIRPAHPRHGGAGALYVILRRR